jgi:uncharacterized Tic20 family protein
MVFLSENIIINNRLEAILLESEKTKNKDENLMAAISHGSMILSISTLIGVFIPLLIWLTQRDKSEFVGFQAKQALIYQFIVLIVSAFLGLVGLVLTVVLIGFVILLLTLLFDIAAVVYALYAAYKVYNGVDFRYVWLGDFLEKN